MSTSKSFLIGLSKNNLLIFFLLFFLSCASNQSLLKEDQVVLNAPKTSSDSEVFQKYFELESIVPIETSKDCLIDYIKRVICHRDKLIILSHGGGIFIVDANTGKVEKSISRMGAGPGESRYILDIAFDEQSGNILVYNDYYKLLYFNMDGDFLKEEKLGENLYRNIICEDGLVYFCQIGIGYSVYPYIVHIYDLKNKTWDKRGENKKVDFNIVNMGNQMVKSKNIWFTAPLDFDLFTVNKDEMYSPYKLDIKTSSVPEDILKNSAKNLHPFLDEVNRQHIIYSVNSVRETEHFLFLRSNQREYYLINKESQEVFLVPQMEDNMLGFKYMEYFPHNGDDNRIMFIVKPQDWMKRFSSADSGQMPPQWKEKIDRIQLEEDSNPILIFYKEKGNEN